MKKTIEELDKLIFDLSQLMNIECDKSEDPELWVESDSVYFEEYFNLLKEKDNLLTKVPNNFTQIIEKTLLIEKPSEKLFKDTVKKLIKIYGERFDKSDVSILNAYLSK